MANISAVADHLRTKFWPLVLSWFRPRRAVPPPTPVRPVRKAEAFGPFEPKIGINNAIHISDLLDRLPSYFENLRALRKADEDAYALFSKLGGTIATEESLFSTAIRPEWIKEPPTIRCLFQCSGDRDGGADKITAPIIYMMRLAGGQVCVGRDGNAVYLPNGLCYRVVLAYVLDGVPHGGSFFVSIQTDGRVKLLSERRVSYQKLRRGKGFSRPEVSQPKWIARIASDKGETPEEFVQHIVAIAMSCQRPKDAILVRAAQGEMSAAWTIDRNDAKRFFAKRETDKASDGRRKRVLHYVGDFSRHVGETIQNVRAHYRGERQFDWKGYHIEVSGLGFHHDDYFDANIAGFEDETASNGKMVSLQKVGAMMRSHYSSPRFLTPAKRRAA